MNYQVTDTNWVSAPKVKQGDPTKVVVQVAVNTGIVGQTYLGFQNQDIVSMEFPISMTGAQMDANTAVQAAAFSAEKYPNT